MSENADLIETSPDDPPMDHSTPIPGGSRYTKNDDYQSAKTKIDNLGDYPVFGYYSIFFLLLSEAILLPQMANMTYMVYGGFVPDVDSCGEHDFRNLSRSETCDRLVQVLNETDCEPQLSAQFLSVAYEFKYYCSTAQQVKHSISLQMFGVLFGAILFGQLSDLFGRRSIMILCAIGMGIFGYISSITNTLASFTLQQFWVLFFSAGTSTISHVLLMETIPKKHRVWVTLAISYSPNYIIFAIIAYFSEDWRTLLRIIAYLNIPTIICLWIAFESPRWLVQKGALKTAKETYEKIEKWNGTASPERQQILEKLIQKEIVLLEQKKKARKYYFHHLFYTWPMMKYSIVLSFSLLCTAMITYALVFNMEKLSGSVYTNNIILGIIRYFFNISCAIVDFKCPKIGRKEIHRWALMFVIVMLMFVFFVKVFDLDYPIATNIAILSATAMCSQLFVVAMVVTSELFPTPVRNIAASFEQIFTRFGIVVAPHFFYLTSFWLPAPYFFMVVFMLANLLTFYFLIPESKGHPMTDHMPPKSERLFIRKSKENKVLTETEPYTEIKDEL